MHDLYLGVAATAIACGLVELLEFKCVANADGAPFADARTTLRAMKADLVRWCKAEKRRCPPTSFTMATLGRSSQTSFPELSSKFKAAHVKTMIPWMADLTARLTDMSSVRSQTRATLFWSLAKFISITDCADRFLSDQEYADVQRTGNSFLTAYVRLAQMAHASGQCLWAVKPKLHYMCHHFEDARINPRYLHCFGDEDFVGKMARIGRACSRQTMSLRILQRYFMFVAMRWHEKKLRVARACMFLVNNCLVSSGRVHMRAWVACNMWCEAR